jgi:8-oxo-dGTP pyrophosphatase MutT (NUDIX family)
MSNPNPEALKALLSNDALGTALPPELTPSAVLLPLFLRDDEYHLVFTKRSLQLKRDGGVICFPGGTWESEDADLTFTALRETHEEIGVLPGDVQVLGGFEPVLTRSKFAIQPVVGVIPHPYLYQPSEAEVAEIIEIPLASLYDPTNLRVEGVLRSEGLTHRFTYVYQGRIIFGATAQILTRLLELIAEGMEKEVPWQSRTPV